MGIAKTYQCYKAAQRILEDWLFCGLTVSGSVTDTYVEATLTKCNVCVPNKVSAALDKVIDGRERAMKYYGYLGQSLIFTRHMHILLLFRWIKSTLENGGPKSSDRFKTPATHLAGQLLAGASTLPTDRDHETTQEEVQKTLLSNGLSENLSNLIKLASTNSLVASQAGCNFTTFGLGNYYLTVYIEWPSTDIFVDRHELSI